VISRNFITNRKAPWFIAIKVLILGITLSLITVNSTGAMATDPSSYQIVVNKVTPLSPLSYRPTDLVTVSKYNPYGRILRREVAAKVIAMGNAMKAAGKGKLIVQSGYRSYSSQKSILKAKTSAIGKTKALLLVAKPGYSEHQTGLAVDFAAYGVSTLTTSFAKTKAGLWLAANAYQYGFVLRYPKGKTAITGYNFEPWHFRYVGIPVATEMHDQGIQTLEEFYGLPAAPDYVP
jgi:D-alanyl-D-alanine carboxypeptidase